MKHSVKIIRKHAAQLGVVLLSMISQATFAVLPTPAQPSRGNAASGDYIAAGQEYIYDFFILAGLVLATVALFFIVRNTLSTYADVPDKRATMGEVFVQAGVGVVIAVFVLWLLTEAATIL